MIDTAVGELSALVGARSACEAVGHSRASHYRAHPVRPPVLGPKPPPAARKRQPRALSGAEQDAVLEVLHSERFIDAAPEAVYASLLDEGVYLCSVATMYRLLRAAGETNGGQDRRRHATHPARVKPELVATQPNQVWSWDITKVRGPQKWTWYHLYVILDIYSRYVVGWMLASRESQVLAERLIKDTLRKQGIGAGQLTIHADRGSSMTSKPVALLMADLGVTKSHSRPRVSNDNPFSESQFKTMKYRPDFPDQFTSIEAARVFCTRFMTWYNHEHHHCGLGLHTPSDVHHGHAGAVREARAKILDQAYREHPERFVHQPPQPPKLPEAAWINKPPAEEPAKEPPTEDSHNTTH
jgi:putative transposase